ncbi:MAG: DUF1178 family protein [Bauldia sp.]
MISFNLTCSKGHEFEGWFRNSANFDDQIERHLVECPDCGDTDVEKGPMAPSVGAKSATIATRSEKAAALRKMRKLMAEVRDHVETNFDNVGTRFPEEARKIFYGEAEDRPIYGDATEDEARTLAEEGVPVARLPWPKKKTEN